MPQGESVAKPETPLLSILSIACKWGPWQHVQSVIRKANSVDKNFLGIQWLCDGCEVTYGFYPVFFLNIVRSQIGQSITICAVQKLYISLYVFILYTISCYRTYLENNVCTRVTNCFRAHKGIIFGVYFLICEATREMNTKMTLEWAQKQFVTRVHTLSYFLHDITNL